MSGAVEMETQSGKTEIFLSAPASKEVRRKKRVGSAVTSGRRLFIGGDVNSAWSRRYRDLVGGFVSDLGGRDALSMAQMSLIRRAAAITCECELMEAKLSAGVEIDLDRFTRSASHLRRILETLGLQRVSRDVTDIRAILTGKVDTP
jgi:hypothetical protein